MTIVAISWEMNLGGRSVSRETSQGMIASVKVREDGGLDDGGTGRTEEKKADLKSISKEQMS